MLLNDARRRQHLSVRAVARIADVPPTTAQGWLNGRHFPSRALRANYLRLLEYLGLADSVPGDSWGDPTRAVAPPGSRMDGHPAGRSGYPVGATGTGSDST